MTKRILRRPSARHERGAVLAILALLIPVLLGALGLVVDNGYLYSVRRDMQLAADAAAVTAAHEIRRSNVDDQAMALLDELQVRAVWNPTNSRGAVVRVELSYPYHPMTGLFAFQTIRLASTSQMVISE